MTQQLLHQEARRRGFAESPEVLAQIEDAKRQLAVNAYLQEEIYGDTSIITDEAVAEEFSARRDQYRVTEDVVRISFAIFDERDAANAFRAKILRGASWSESVHQVQGDDEIKDHILRIETSKYFSQAMLYPEELWKVARTLSKEDISYVIRTAAGYCVALVHEAIKQGELPTLEYARDEIRKRLEIVHRTAKYNELVATLRAKGDIEIRLGSSDTTVQHSQE